MRNLIVTADDLGLTDEINRGIQHAAASGIVTAASLLVHAPATEAAVAVARQLPQLEVGLHLAIVESWSMLAEARGGTNTLTDRDDYFPGKRCLHRHRGPFMRRYLTGRLDLGELEQELELKGWRFLDYFPRVPFANGTQHLHLLPGVQKIVARLARKYRFGAVRVAGGAAPRPFAPRWAQTQALLALSRPLRARLTADGVGTTDAFAGFAASGRLDRAALLAEIARLGEGTTELMTHPGYDMPALRAALPVSYAAFRWQDELAAVTDPEVRARLASEGVTLGRFADMVRA